MFYCNDRATGSRPSLRTKDGDEAEGFVLHKNKALKNSNINRKIGLIYLSNFDLEMCEWTWKTFMEHIIKGKDRANAPSLYDRPERSGV